MTTNRCSQCLLPSTYPDISFNQEGVCKYCLGYKKNNPIGEDLFLEKINSKRGNRYECVLGISGGKDSCYVAYLVKKKFGLRALAVSYDFPFMVDLARENIRKVCETLGLELLIIKSRNNLEYNLLRNHLVSLAGTGTTWGQCLFCHYGIEAILWEIARSREIPFILSGVTSNEVWWQPGNRMSFLGERLKKLPLGEKATFGLYQSKAYINLVDQRRQFPIPGNHCFNVYKEAHAPVNGPETVRVFDYIEWNQDLIEKTLQEETGWIRPAKTLSWRYDCILEPLLDYTYFKEFGISSAGLYLCGLIRSGLISREEALLLLEKSEDPTQLDASLKTVLDFLNIPPRTQQKFQNVPWE